MARILLVEDDEDNIHLLTRLLTHHGHEIEVADNAEAAFDGAVSFLPELILMDLEIPPGPDCSPHPNAGLDATRRLKANEGTASIPVVALTAHTMPHHHEKIADAGCDDFQQKPISPFDSLLRKIETHVGG